MVPLILLGALTVAVSGPATSPEYLPLRVAEADGYFTREGVSVTLKTTRAEAGAAEALSQGQVDLAATSLESLLRFGPRIDKQRPRLVFGLTAAPPVVLLVSTGLGSTVRSVENLLGLRVGVAAPGAPEHTWLTGLLARSKIKPSQVDVVSLGTRGLASAVESGDVQAGLVPEPFATRLLSEGRATVLADLRSPEAVQRAMGVPTVNGAVFLRADRRPSEADLTAFVRALLAAERRLAAASPEAIAERLPKAVTGSPDEFERRLDATRGLYLPDGLVTPEQLRESVALISAHMSLPPTLKVPRPEEMLHTAPLRRALQSPGS